MPVTGFSNLSVLNYTYVLEEGYIRLRHQVSLKSADHAMTIMLQCLRHRCLGEGRSRGSLKCEEEKNLASLIRADG